MTTLIPGILWVGTTDRDDRHRLFNENTCLSNGLGTSDCDHSLLNPS